MRVSRKPGLRIPHKTITLKGARNEYQYCTINGETYNSGEHDVVLSLPVGTVITLYTNRLALSSETGAIIVNEKKIKEVGMPLRYVVVADAEIMFGYDYSYDHSISVNEAGEKTIWFEVSSLGTDIYVDNGKLGTFVAKERMTWANLANNRKYQELPASANVHAGFSTLSGNVNYYEGDGTFGAAVTTADGTDVKPADEIMAGYTYVLVQD